MVLSGPKRNLPDVESVGRVGDEEMEPVEPALAEDGVDRLGSRRRHHGNHSRHGARQASNAAKR